MFELPNPIGRFAPLFAVSRPPWPRLRGALYGDERMSEVGDRESIAGCRLVGQAGREGAGTAACDQLRPFHDRRVNGRSCRNPPFAFY